MTKCNTISKIAILPIILSCLVMTPTLHAEGEPVKVLRYKTFERDKIPPSRQYDQYYLRLIAEYAHFREKNNKDFWKRLRSIFKDVNRKVLVTASGGFTAASEHIESSRLLLSLDPNGETFKSYIRYGAAVMPAIRLQPSTSVSLMVEIKDTGIKKPTVLFETLSKVDSIPLINNLTSGYITLATSVIDSVTEIGGDDSTNLGVRIDFNSVDELFKTEYIAVYSSYDENRINELGDKIPRKASEKSSANLHEFPSVILFRVDIKEKLLSPDLILNKSLSVVSDSLEEHLNRLKDIDNNREKILYCKHSLRPFLQDTLNLNRSDRAMASIIITDRAGYDPDRSNFHRNIPGCYSDAELAEVRRMIAIGSCQSNKCQATIEFLLRWFNSQSLSDLLSDKFKVTNKLGGGYERKEYTSDQFLSKFALERPFGEFDTILGGGAGLAVGVVLVIKETAQRYNANITFGFRDGFHCESDERNDDCQIVHLELSERG